MMIKTQPPEEISTTDLTFHHIDDFNGSALSVNLPYMQIDTASLSSKITSCKEEDVCYGTVRMAKRT
jgi:hypothetical protein